MKIQRIDLKIKEHTTGVKIIRKSKLAKEKEIDRNKNGSRYPNMLVTRKLRYNEWTPT